MADGGIIHRTKEKDKGTYCAAKISFMIVHYVENKSFLFVDKDSCPQEDLSFYWDLGLSLENCGYLFKKLKQQRQTD